MQTAKKGKNLGDIRYINRALIVDLMRRQNIRSRADLTKHSGLNQATVTNIVSELIDCGLVYETGLIEGKKGRRIIGLDLNCEKYRFMSVRLTREHLLVAVYDIRGNQHSCKHVVINTENEIGQIIENIKKEIRAQIGQLDGKTLLSAGIAVLGPFLKSEDHFVFATGFPNLKDIHLIKELQQEFNVPVYADHDANLAAYAEWQRFAGTTEKGLFLYIMGGQGLGAGIIDNGSIMRGQLGVAGEIGHMSINIHGKKCVCGNKGCLEQYASGFAMLNMLNERLPDYPDSMLTPGSGIHDIFNAFHLGDKLAVGILDDVAWHLGFGIASLINVINPGTIIIGDDFQKGGPPFLKKVCESVKEHALPELYNKVNIQISEFKEDPALAGAAMLAIDEMLRNERLFDRLLD